MDAFGVYSMDPSPIATQRKIKATGSQSNPGVAAGSPGRTPRYQDIKVKLNRVTRMRVR
jgi:hypothetical protein